MLEPHEVTTNGPDQQAGRRQEAPARSLQPAGQFCKQPHQRLIFHLLIRMRSLQHDCPSYFGIDYPPYTKVSIDTFVQ
jgi:hypothetical protein